MVKKIAILSTTPPIEFERFQDKEYDLVEARDILDSFTRRLNDRSNGDYQFVSVQYMNLELSVKDQEASIKDSASGMDLADFDFVYVKSWKRFEDASAAIAVYLNEKKVHFDPKEINRFKPTSKITEAFLMWARNMPIPDTYYSPANHRLKSMLDENFSKGEKMVVKDHDGSGGHYNFLIDDTDKLAAILSDHPFADFVAQEFIPNDSDFRIFIVSGEVKLIIRRIRDAKETHLNNTSQGASAELIALEEFDSSLLRQSEKLAKELDRTVAGVDIMFNSENGKPYFLEINKSPQMGSGAFMDEKLEVLYDYLTGNA